MKLGAMRCINASCLVCPVRILIRPDFNDEKDCFKSSSVVITIAPPSTNAAVISVFTSGGAISITTHGCLNLLIVLGDRNLLGFGRQAFGTSVLLDESRHEFVEYTFLSHSKWATAHETRVLVLRRVA